jgi:flagellar motility protein MotE (MotC chaperone)
MVADATLVSLAAVRQAVKNVMLVRALRDDVDFDEEWYADAARRELEELAGEAAAEAARLREVREATRRRRGAARAADDYRAADSRHLKRRARVLEELVEELGRLTQDDTTVSTLIAEARLRALDEITATTASVPGLGRERAATGIARSRALQSLREELSDYAD